MVLVLVLHTLDDITATVPMCVILLNDMQIRKQIPEGFHLREVVPTTGQTSTSIWDVTDLAFFSEWLGQSLGPGVTHSVMEIVERFSIGLMGHVKQARTAEKAKNQLAAISTSTKTAVSKAGEQLTEFDKKYDISERTSQTFKKMSTAASQAKERAMENPTINRVSTNVNAGVQAGIKSMGLGIDWARQRLSGSLGGGTSPARTQPGNPPTEPPVNQAPPVSTTAPPPATRVEGNREAVFDLEGDDDGA